MPASCFLSNDAGRTLRSGRRGGAAARFAAGARPADPPRELDGERFAGASVTVDFLVAFFAEVFGPEDLRSLGVDVFFAACLRVVFVRACDFLDEDFFAVFFAVFFAGGFRVLDVDGLRAVFLTVFFAAFLAVFLAGDFREVFFAVFFAAFFVEALDVLFFELPREVELRAAVFFAGLMGAGR